tara:strand:- start:2651 stop:3178 length:528 start_codon:yes stop_codon:yes gene_type:complete
VRILFNVLVTVIVNKTTFVLVLLDGILTMNANHNCVIQPIAQGMVFAKTVVNVNAAMVGWAKDATPKLAHVVLTVPYVPDMEVATMQPKNVNVKLGGAVKIVVMSKKSIFHKVACLTMQPMLPCAVAMVPVVNFLPHLDLPQLVNATVTIVTVVLIVRLPNASMIVLGTANATNC